MRDHGAIVEQVVDLDRIVHEWEMLEGQEQRSMAEFRTAKAKLLIKARGGFTGRADGFKAFVVNKLKTPYTTALDWMKAAGYSPPKSDKADQYGSRTDSNKSDDTASEHSKEPGGGDTSTESKPTAFGKETASGKEQDPENYRTAFLLRANAAVEYATMTPPLLAEYYRFKPRGRDKHHSEFIAIARRAAAAWTDLVNQLESK